MTGMAGILLDLTEECFGPVLCVVVMLCFLFGNRKRYEKRIYSSFLVLSVMLFTEVISTSVELQCHHNLWIPELRLVLSWVCYILQPALLLLVTEITLRDQKKLVKLLLTIPAAINFLAVSTCFFSPICFTINPLNNEWEPGPLIVSTRITIIFYIAILIIVGIISIRTSKWESLVLLLSAAFVILDYLNEIFIAEYAISIREIAISIASLAYLMYFTAISHKEEVKVIHDTHEEREEMITKQMVDQCIETLAFTIDAKDKYTKGHSSRVAKYSRMIAQLCGKSEEECRKVYLAGLLHDIGKISIANSIINKPSRLSDEEYDKIKQHPIRGAIILEKMTSLPFLQNGAKYHHERYDGKGYPFGIKGNDIPELARIIAVADSYDAMTSYRSYRPTMDQAVVKQELWKGMGTQFDPFFAKVMIAIIDSDSDYELREKKETADLIEIDDKSKEIIWPTAEPLHQVDDIDMMQTTDYNTLAAFICMGGDWAVPTEGFEVPSDYRKIGFHGITRPEAPYVWCAPVVILFSSDDGKLLGNNYDELAVFLTAGYSWRSGSSISEHSSFSYGSNFTDWNNWIEQNKAGLLHTLTVRRENNMIVLNIDNGLIDSEAHITLPEDYDKKIYVAFSGERCDIDEVKVLSK